MAPHKSSLDVHSFLAKKWMCQALIMNKSLDLCIYENIFTYNMV